MQRALEKKLEEREEQKQQILQSIDQHSNNKMDSETALEAVLSFMQNPYKTWANGDLKQKNLVQRLVFINPIVIHQSQPIGTVHLSFPFKMLRMFLVGNFIWAATITLYA